MRAPTRAEQQRRLERLAAPAREKRERRRRDGAPGVAKSGDLRVRRVDVVLLGLEPAREAAGRHAGERRSQAREGRPVQQGRAHAPREREGYDRGAEHDPGHGTPEPSRSRERGGERAEARERPERDVRAVGAHHQRHLRATEATTPSRTGTAPSATAGASAAAPVRRHEACGDRSGDVQRLSPAEPDGEHLSDRDAVAEGRAGV